MPNQTPKPGTPRSASQARLMAEDGPVLSQTAERALAPGTTGAVRRTLAIVVNLAALLMVAAGVVHDLGPAPAGQPVERLLDSLQSFAPLAAPLVLLITASIYCRGPVSASIALAGSVALPLFWLIAWARTGMSFHSLGGLLVVMGMVILSNGWAILVSLACFSLRKL